MAIQTITEIPTTVSRQDLRLKINLELLKAVSNFNELYGETLVDISTLATALNQTDGSQSTKILGATSATTQEQLLLDPSSHALKIIDYAHAEVHGGDSFYFHDVISVANGASQSYVVTVPDLAKNPHIELSVEFMDGAGTKELFEGGNRVPTTLQTAFNRDRNSLDTNTTTIHKGYTGGTTDGTRIVWKRTGTGKISGGSAGTAEERILKQNTQYIFKVTNNAGATNNATVIIRWYEHTFKG